MTEVFTLTETSRRSRPVTILEDRVETSSMLRILTFSLETPAVVAMLEIYKPSFATKIVLDIGNITTMTMVSDCEHESDMLFS